MTKQISLDTKLGAITPGDLPTPPEVALRVMHACADTNITSRQLAKLIGSDTALVAELLRVANSPYFGVGRNVTTPAQAVVVLGTRSLRNFVLSFSARESLRAETLSGFDALGFWEAALRRAVGARLLADMVGVAMDEAFTVGMLQDFGLLTLFMLYPELAPKWHDLATLDPDERYQLEQEIFGATHDQVARLLMQTWQLPDEIALPVADHHSNLLDELPASSTALARIASCADWIAAVFSASDKRLVVARCRKLLGDYFSLSATQTDELLAAVPSGVEEAAAALSMRVAPQADFATVLKEANRKLLLQEDAQTQRLERALAERERLTEELQLAYDRLAQLAYYDPLTTLVNRRRFEDLFSAEIARHSRSGKTLSLLMLDLDHFKSLNDNHGHLFGDAVLQAVAGVLKSTLRASDVAARVGGEEMCLLLPETDDDGGRVAAERVRCAIDELSFPHPSGLVRVSASLGGCAWSLPSENAGDIRQALQAIPAIMSELLERADQAMYRSKQSGRNRVTWMEGALDEQARRA